MSDDARETWLLMSDLVLENTPRREVSEALGMSFGRTRALRRLARGPMSMRALADSMGVDPPNATVIVAGLEQQGLAERRPHPTDGRAKVVEATAKGRELARTADDILATPPRALAELSPDELETLRDLLLRLRRV
jgi:DNA-binding MarR family transcriptional regulator